MPVLAPTPLTQQLSDLAFGNDAAADLLRQLDGLANPFGHIDGAVRLPSYALDGRELTWNADRTAVSFASSPAEYFSDISAVSSSSLRALEQSPAHMRSRALNPEPETNSQLLGTAVHCAVLEAERFEEAYVAFKGARRSGAEYELFVARNKGKVVLTPQEMEKVRGCAEALRSTVCVVTGEGQFTLADLIAGGETEKTVYWHDAATNLTCKARLDLVAGPLILDVKTTDDARPQAFAYQAGRLGYDVQAAFYRRATQAIKGTSAPLPFVLVAGELKAPHGTQAMPCDEEEFMSFGERRVAKAMKLYAECSKTQCWPGYPRFEGALKLPLGMRYPSEPLGI